MDIEADRGTVDAQLTLEQQARAAMRRDLLDYVGESLALVNRLQAGGVGDWNTSLAYLKAAIESAQTVLTIRLPRNSGEPSNGDVAWVDYLDDDQVQVSLRKLRDSLGDHRRFDDRAFVLQTADVAMESLLRIVEVLEMNATVPGSRASKALLHRLSEQKERLITERRALALTSRQEDALSRVEAAAKRAENHADHATEAAGIVAEGSLSTEFDALAEEEEAQAVLFRRATIGLSSLVAGYAGLVAFIWHNTTPDLWHRLAVSLPVLLLTGYLGRESSQHRQTARWARVLGVQLRTVKAYSDQLDEDSRRDLLHVFGKRVFADVAASTGGEANPGVDAETLLAKLPELVKAMRS